MKTVRRQPCYEADLDAACAAVTETVVEKTDQWVRALGRCRAVLF